MPNLKGKVAVVTGASRGAGRGIAVVLGEAGTTVYVTGRSVKGEPTAENIAGTVDETAEAVTARGGVGISVRCDHTVDAEVEALFARIQQEQNRLDLLVNNVWGGYEQYESDAGFSVPFWEQPLRHWQGMFTAGVRAHLVTSRFAVPLMLPHRQGLIVNTIAWDRDKYLGNLYYDVAKNAIARMAYGMALELREYNIAVVAVAPGFMRTERVLAHFNTDEQSYHSVDALSRTESPQYIGRAIAALAADPNIMQKSGSVLTAGDLAQEYGFTDIDGRQIPAFRIDEE